MRNLRQRVFLFGILVLAPLIVAGFAWRQTRGLPDKNFYENDFPLLEAAVYDGMPQTHVPAHAQRVVRERGTEVRRLIETVPRRELAQEYERVKRYPALRLIPKISLSAFALALFASAAGASGLLFMSVAGRRSMASRAALYFWFGRGLKLLPFMLLGASLPLILALCCIGVSSVIRGYASPAGISARDVAVAIFAVALAGVAGSLARKVRTVFRGLLEAGPVPLSGTPLSPEAAPRVWEMVSDVARRGGLPMPECIVMGFGSGFHVTRGVPREGTAQNAGNAGDAEPVKSAQNTGTAENTQSFESEKHTGSAQNTKNTENLESTKKSEKDEGRTTLYLCLPLMLVMEEDELRSVVAHELGHLRSADLEYREKFGLIYLSAHETIRLLVSEHATDPYARALFAAAERFAALFLDSFHAADMRWSRERELAADGVAASVAGREATALALVRSALYMPPIEAFIGAFRRRGGGWNLIASLREHLSAVTPASLESVLESEQPHPFDTHPCLRERLAQFGLERDASLGTRAAAIRPGDLLARLGL